MGILETCEEPKYKVSLKTRESYKSWENWLSLKTVGTIFILNPNNIVSPITLGRFTTSKL